MRRIYKFGLAVIEDNKLLLCEPYAFKDLILPGGIKEADESHVDNLLREVSEELGEDAILDTTSLMYIGKFEDVAAGRSYRLVEIDLYIGSLGGRLTPSSEIKELHWFSPKDDHDRLSAIIRNKILPYLIEHKYLLS
jgi:8-oxo-dGTP pyrophosphatase MutT (NUDIX family)